MNTSCANTPSEAATERLARKRAAAKLGWYTHACVYVLVNLLLAFVSARTPQAQGYPWAIYPALGWGLGLLMHGVGVWVGMPGGSLYQHLLARERAQLRQHPPQ